jgi:hypothetical protein
MRHIIAGLITGFLTYQIYVNVALEQRIKTLESHTETLAKSVQNLDYELSVLADLQRNMK